MGEWDPEDEFQERLAVIRLACDHFDGTQPVEHLLVDLLRFMKSGRLDRERQVAALVKLVPWPWESGSIEILEFTMRELQYPEVADRARTCAREDPNPSAARMLGQILEVYEDVWPNGEIYRTYRVDEPDPIAKPRRWPRRS